jgi:hypothetical protein
VALLLEAGAQHLEVLDDAVVDHGDPPGTVEVGVGVAIRRRPVGGPARVPHADRPGGTALDLERPSNSLKRGAAA